MKNNSNCEILPEKMMGGQTHKHGSWTAKLGQVEFKLLGVSILRPFHWMDDYIEKYYTDDRVYLVCFQENKRIIINIVVKDVRVFGTIFVHGWYSNFS